MPELSITINNIPVSVNAFYRTYKNRVILSKRGRQYKKDMRDIIRDALRCNGMCLDSFEKISCPIELDINIYFKDKRKRDIDNYLKSLLDSIEDTLIVNDTQIQSLSIRKHIGHGLDQTSFTIKY